MEQVQGLFEKASGTSFSYKIGSIYFEPSYLQALLIVFLLFLLVFAFARMRYLYVHWSLGKSAVAMAFWGFLLAIILEGLLLVGGRSFLTVIFGWNNAPKPISTALDVGRERLINVLGVSDGIEERQYTSQEIIEVIEKLPLSETEAVKEYLCQ